MKRLIAASVCALAAVGGAAYFLFEEPVETAPPAVQSSPAVQATPPAEKPAEGGKIDPETPLRVEPVLRPADKFPEKVSLHHDGKKTELKFTGSFTRVRPILFVNLHVYEIASYVESPAEGKADEQLAELQMPNRAKVFLLRFVRSLSGSQVKGAIDEEIALTFGDVDMERLGENIKRFTEPFGAGAKKGDVVYLAWLPKGRAYSGYKRADELKLVADDFGLARAIWRIWAGPTAGPERYGLVKKYSMPAAN